MIKRFFSFTVKILKDQRGEIGEDIGAGGDQAADVSGEAGSTGGQDDANVEDKSVSQEPGKETGTEGEKFDSPPLETRVQQLLEKTKALEDQANRERVEREQIAEKLKQAEQMRPTYEGDEVVARVQYNIVLALRHIKQLEAEIELEESPTFQQAERLLQLQEYVRDARTALKENEKKKYEFESRITMQQRQEQETQAKWSRFGQIADIYAGQNQVPKEIMDKAADMFRSEMQADKIFAAKFNDKFFRQNDEIGAFELAYNHVQNKMALANSLAVSAMQKKEEGKINMPPGKSASGVTNNADIAGLLKKAQQTGSEEDFLAYTAAKRQRT